MTFNLSVAARLRQVGVNRISDMGIASLSARRRPPAESLEAQSESASIDLTRGRQGHNPYSFSRLWS
jgi:hypothetical protein